MTERIARNGSWTTGAPFDSSTRPPLDLIPAELHPGLEELDGLMARWRRSLAEAESMVTPAAIDSAVKADRVARAQALRDGRDPQDIDSAEKALAVKSDAKAAEAQAAHDAAETVRYELADIAQALREDPKRTADVDRKRKTAAAALQKAQEALADAIDAEAALVWLHAPANGFRRRRTLDPIVTDDAAQLLASIRATFTD